MVQMRFKGPVVLVCDKCEFSMPYGPEVAETPCPYGYPHDWTYPNMVVRRLEPLPPLHPTLLGKGC